MKKRFVLISIIVLVLVLALFLLSACDQGRTEVGVELVLNGDLASTSSGENGTIVDNWTIGGEWDEDLDSPYSYQRLDSESSLYEEHGTGYVILETGDSGWVYLSQGFAVDRRAVYQVSFDARLVSYENGDTDESRGAFVTFLENVEFIMSEQTSAGEWKSYTVYVRPINTDYLTIALSLGAEGAECDGVAHFDNISVTRVDESALAAGTTIHDFRMSQIARYNRDLSGTLFVTFLTIFGFAAVVAAYVIVKKLYARNDVFVEPFIRRWRPSSDIVRFSSQSPANRKATYIINDMTAAFPALTFCPPLLMPMMIGIAPVISITAKSTRNDDNIS